MSNEDKSSYVSQFVLEVARDNPSSSIEVFSFDEEATDAQKAMEALRKVSERPVALDNNIVSVELKKEQKEKS